MKGSLRIKRHPANKGKIKHLEDKTPRETIGLKHLIFSQFAKKFLEAPFRR